MCIRDSFGLEALKLIHTRHGAGDRAIGFDKASGRFDLVLLSGEKIRDRLAAAGLDCAACLGENEAPTAFSTAGCEAPGRLALSERAVVVGPPRRAKKVERRKLEKIDFFQFFFPTFRKGDCRCLLYTSPSPRDKRQSRMPSSA